MVPGVVLTAEDPFMSEFGALEGQDDKGCCGMKRLLCTEWCCTNYCCNWCLPPRLWIARRCRVCFLCTWVNCKWACIMSCLCCWFGCLECCKIWGMLWGWCTGKTTLNELRRDCARRFKLPDTGENDEEQDTACCCVPLRTAVFALSVVTSVNAFCAFFFPAMWATKAGYSTPSRVVLGATQITGLFFGPVGCLGAYELNVSLLKSYNLYQFIRLGGLLFMLYNDASLLVDCNIWKTDLQKAIQEYGWNPSMYNVALGNQCLQAQFDFLFMAFWSLVVYTYLISLTRRLIWDTESTPRYLLSLPRDTPNGAFIRHDRTQGKTKPPYGAVLGESLPMGPKGILEKTDGFEGLVGPPVGHHEDGMHA